MFITDGQLAEIEAERNREADLFDAVLGGEDGIREWFRQDGNLAPSAEDVADLLAEAEDRADYSAVTTVVREPDALAAIEKLRGALAPLAA